MAIHIRKTDSKHVTITEETAKRLLPLSGDAVRLYLQLALGMTSDLQGEGYIAAETALIAAGLAYKEEEKPLSAADSALPDVAPPDYTIEEAVSLQESDDDFSHLAQEAERVLGRLLTGSDLTMLMTIYSYFGLSAECMFLLLHFTSQRTARQSDGNRRPTLLTIKREALRWLENGVDTPEKADTFIRHEHKMMDQVDKMEKVLALPAYSNDERRQLRNYAELGFDERAVLIARDISQKRVNEVSFAYMGRVLRGWKKENLLQADEILRFEQERSKRQGFGSSKPAKGERRLTQEELEGIRRAQELMEKGQK